MDNFDAKVQLSEKDGLWYANLTLKVGLTDNVNEITSAFISQKLEQALLAAQKEYFSVTLPPKPDFEPEFHPPLPEASVFASLECQSAK